MKVTWDKFYFRISKTPYEESQGVILSEDSSTDFMRYYEKRNDGFYYPIILGKNTIFEIKNNSLYSIKGKSYDDTKVLDNGKPLSNPLECISTASGIDIFLKNNWEVDEIGRLIEFKENSKPKIFELINSNKGTICRYNNYIPHRGDAIRYIGNNNKIQEYLLTDYFKVDIDMKNGLISFLVLEDI